jgi:hypothetical protein
MTHPDETGRQIAEEVLEDFRRMFPGVALSSEVRQYLMSLIQRAVAELLRTEENDWK